VTVFPIAISLSLHTLLFRNFQIKILFTPSSMSWCSTMESCCVKYEPFKIICEVGPRLVLTPTPCLYLAFPWFQSRKANIHFTHWDRLSIQCNLRTMSEFEICKTEMSVLQVHRICNFCTIRNGPVILIT
jgi:hypothetical protein